MGLLQRHWRVCSREKTSSGQVPFCVDSGTRDLNIRSVRLTVLAEKVVLRHLRGAPCLNLNHLSPRSNVRAARAAKRACLWCRLSPPGRAVTSGPFDAQNATKAARPTLSPIR